MQLVYSTDDNGYYYQRAADWKTSQVFSSPKLAERALSSNSLIWSD